MTAAISGTVLMGSAAVLSQLPTGHAAGVVAIVTLVAAGATVVSVFGAGTRREVHRRRDALWARFWRGSVGRWLFRLAGRGLRHTAPSRSDRPTEIALGSATEALFSKLPDTARRTLQDLPRIVRRLETSAQRLRNEDREPVRARLGDVLTALETIRLDLLRLDGGTASTSTISADLTAARELGEHIDRLLDARRDLENL
jgi:hypothetical protein